MKTNNLGVIFLESRTNFTPNPFVCVFLKIQIPDSILDLWIQNPFFGKEVT